MKIEFRKIAFEPKNFALNLKDSDFDIKITGTILRQSDDLIKITSHFSGEIALVCDRSGEEFMKDLDLDLVLFAKNGKWNETKRESHGDENLAVIEIFENSIDLNEIFLGEIESIKLDYHTKD